MNFLKPKALTQKQRFNRALLFSIPIGLILGIAHYVVNAMIPFVSFSIIYVIVGYLAAQAIQYVSHGVGIKFRYIAVLTYVISILVSDVLVPAFLYDVNVLFYFQLVFRSMIQPSGLLSLAFRVVGGIAAYWSLG